MIEARRCAEHAAESGLGSPFVLGLCAEAMKDAGDTSRAEEYLSQLRLHPYGPQTGLTVYHIARREFDAAVDCALKAVNERIPGFIANVVRPSEQFLSTSPRWRELLMKLNLPEAL
jgi:hypothetical protein